MSTAALGSAALSTVVVAAFGAYYLSRQVALEEQVMCGTHAAVLRARQRLLDTCWKQDVKGCVLVWPLGLFACMQAAKCD